MTRPLAIRLATGTRDQLVTRHASGLSFTKTAPGGHHSARVRLNLPHRNWASLGAADRLYVYDTRDGSTVWEGYTTNPTPTRSDAGEGYDLSVLGGMSLASDDRRALLYHDQESTAWKRAVSSTQPQSTKTEWAPRPMATDVMGLLLGFTPGQPIANQAVAEMAYTAVEGWEIGRITSVYRSGVVDGDYYTRIGWPGGGVDKATMNTGAFSYSHYAGDGTFPTGVTQFWLTNVRGGAATNVVDDNRWTHHRNIRVQGRRMLRNGTIVTGPPWGSDTHIKVHEVVEDLLGRMLRNVDGAGASINTSSVYSLQQLVYRQAVTAATVLDDLIALEPNFLWEILESTPSGHRFAWRLWPTAVRYEVSAREWSARGGDVTLANRIVVSWTEHASEGDVEKTLTVAVTVPELGSRIVHADPITLPEGRGNASIAQRVGAGMLALLADPPLAGTAVVRRKIVDHNSGCLVPPWRIEPGYLVRVRETGDVLRLTEMTYDDDAGAATLTLGEPSLTESQRIARLSASR